MEKPGDLEFLLDFDGAAFAFEAGYWIKIKAHLVEAIPAKPHGLDYSLTLHAPNGSRILGFDNAHGVAEPGSWFKTRPAENDHCHRAESDAGRPYAFVDAPTLIVDFFEAVERMLTERGVAYGSMIRDPGANDDENQSTDL